MDSNNSEVVLEKEDLESFAKMATNGKQLDTAIFKNLVSKKVNQELLFQYGLSLNLHQSNSQIKEQIILAAQKLIMDQSILKDPGDSVLNAYLVKNSTRFNSIEVYSFEQYAYTNLYDAQQALFTINTGNKIEDGDTSITPNFIESESKLKLKEVFGTNFCDSLINQNTGWRGIVQSNLAYHVIVGFNKKNTTMDIRKYRAEIYNHWKEEQAIVFYNEFLLSLQEKTKLKVISDEYQFLINQ